MFRFSHLSYPLSRIILGAGASLLVIAISLAGISGDGDPADTIPVTAPNTVVVTKPSTTPAPTTTTTVAPTTTTTEPPIQIAETSEPYKCAEWIPTAVEVGWPNDPEMLSMLGRVMYRESRCRPEARSKSSDTGLLQVNDYWCEPSRYTDNPSGWLGDRMPLGSCADLTDPVKNLQAGLLIWYYSQTKNGNGWHPWRYSGPTE